MKGIRIESLPLRDYSAFAGRVVSLNESSSGILDGKPLATPAIESDYSEIGNQYIRDNDFNYEQPIEARMASAGDMINGNDGQWL